MIESGDQYITSNIRSAADQGNREDGFTMVELMIGLSIFLIVVASCFACLRVGNSMVDNARHFTRASQIMQTEIERIRSMAWGTLTALPTAETELTLSSQFVHPVYEQYTLTRSITGTGDMRTITVQVTWEDMTGRSHTRRYITMYTKGGLYDYIQ